MSADQDATLRSSGSEWYLIRLFVEGNASHSMLAIQMVKRVCDERLSGSYRLEIIDLHQQIALAERDGVVVAPTLLKLRPAPFRRTVGNLTRDRILTGLDLSP